MAAVAAALAPADPIVPSSKAVLARIARMAESDRFRRLDRLEQYYRLMQHAHKKFEWDGRLVSRSDAVEVMPGIYIPMRKRRPSTPYHLARVIVDRFTALLFSESRWPVFRVENDEAGDDFVRELVRASKLSTRMTYARRFGGAQGSVGISYRWWDGMPRVEVHNPKHVEVVEWADREELVPARVVKSYRYAVDEWDPREQKMVRVEYVYRREWSTDAEVLYQPMRLDDLRRGVEKNAAVPEWAEDRVVAHGLGFCPFVWVQNCPSEEVDGEPDYEGLTDCDGCSSVFDQVDILLSALVSGTTSNVDPTLVLKVDPKLARGAVLKGSDNSLKVGQGGDAKYLELSGSSIDVGIRLLECVRKYALEVSSCVLVDPDKISGAAQSAKAIELLFQPMLSKASVLRDQWGEVALRVVEGLRAAARLSGGKNRLRLRIVEHEDDATQEVTREWVSRDPGGDGPTTLQWPPFFDLTALDRQAEVQTAQTATGGKPIISQETAAKRVAGLFDIEDVAAELERIRVDDELANAGREMLFGGEGREDESPGAEAAEQEEEHGTEQGGTPGQVAPGVGEVPPTELPVAAAVGGLPPKIAQQAALGEKLEIFSYHLDAGVVTINEARS